MSIAPRERAGNDDAEHEAAPMLRILGLSGSLRRGSFNRRLLLTAATEFPDCTRLEIFERLADIPPYDEDQAAAAVVHELRQAISTADAVLVSTPEYNASVPGQLKNALDWASRPFPGNALRGKPVAVVGASTGESGAARAQADLRKVLATIGAYVIDAELPVSNSQGAFTRAGRLADRQLRDRLTAIVEQLLASASASTPDAARPVVSAWVREA